MAGGVVVFEHARQELDRDQQCEGRPAGNDAADGAGLGGGYVRGEAGGGAGDERGPGQPAGSAAGAPAGEQDQGRDDLHAIDRQRERMSVPAGLTVASASCRMWL
jgi:hypothetical protein